MADKRGKDYNKRLNYDELKDKITAFIGYFNDVLAKPFKWTYKARAPEQHTHTHTHTNMDI